MAREPDSESRDLFIERFKGNLIRARHAAGVSQGMLGEAADLHTTEVSKLERGERIPRLDTAVRLASALGVSVAALVAGISWERPPVRRGGHFAAKPNDRISSEGQ